VPGAVLDGVIGPGRIFPCRSWTATFSNSPGIWGLAAQGGTWCHFLGLDPDGNEQKEPFFLPAGGGVEIVSDYDWSQPLEIYIGACDAAGGGSTFISGVSNARVAYSALDYGISAYERARDPQQIAATAGLTTDTTFVANEPLDVVLDGTVAVVVEATANLAVAVGDPVAVRMVQVGNNVRGQFTRFTSPGPVNSNFARLHNAEWISAAAAGGIALVRIWR